ncbi:MAG: hypothetical protein ACHQCF_03415 [Solirubrobacterales bacterium]
MSRKFDLDGEVVAEEDAVEAEGEGAVRAIEPYRDAAAPAVIRTEVRTAAIAAAGGALAGAVTVAAVRALGSEAGSRGRSPRRLSRRRNERPANVLASRSFLVDVHLLGR